jgi:hypothetical protein
MKNKQLIKIINEEISEFDFLGNEQYVKEEEGVNVIKNEEFQKQFICDLLLKRKEKIKTLQVVQSEFGDNWEEREYMTIDYIIELAYTYDTTKEPAKLGLQLKGDRIGYSEDSDYDPGKLMGTMPDSTPPSGGNWFNQIDWDAIDVEMFSIEEGFEGDKIEFSAFEHAPKRIQHLFLRDMLSDFISHGAGNDMKTPADYDNATKVGYC